MNATSPGRNVLSGLFHHGAEAELALAELKSAGYTRAEISEVDSDATDAPGDVGAMDDRSPRATDHGSATTAAPAANGSFFREHEARASSFLDELLALNFSKRDAQHLVDCVVAGQALLTVDAGTLGVAGATVILERHDAHIFVAQEGEFAAAAAGGAAIDSRVPRPDATDGVRELELREERLQIDKRRVQHGEARVSKRVITETQTIEVPVTHEELVIERTPGSGRAAAGTITASDEIVIPLSTEVVNVEKRVVATEEITIGKRDVAGVEHVAETLRHEELVVGDDSGITRDRKTP